MLQITAQSKIYLAIEPIDFRKGLDALAALCQQQFNKDPFSGYLFVFSNRSKTAIKILAFDGQGMWLAMKRLSQGKFHWWPKAQESPFTLSPSQLQILLWNGNPIGAQIPCDWKKVG
jgi:transposase